MQVIRTAREMAVACRDATRPLGLVPTMGALHEGHLSLVRQARGENETLAATIFVNPTQFGATEDLSAYPRPLEDDLAALLGEHADLVYVPPEEEVYPQGFDTWVDVPGLGDRLEGAHRPGHFRGVATVVAKLFGLIRPDRAYFGQKDGQQTVVIRRLARDLDLGVDVVVAPTVREPDGLALSSRNVYLSEGERNAAPVVYRSLCEARRLWEGGVRDADMLRNEARRVLDAEPRVARIDYVSVADVETLEELDTVDGRAMVSVAVQIGRPRLIDNIVLG